MNASDRLIYIVAWLAVNGGSLLLDAVAVWVSLMSPLFDGVFSNVALGLAAAHVLKVGAMSALEYRHRTLKMEQMQRVIDRLSEIQRANGTHQ